MATVVATAIAVVAAALVAFVVVALAAAAVCCIHFFRLWIHLQLSPFCCLFLLLFRLTALHDTHYCIFC